MKTGRVWLAGSGCGGRSLLTEGVRRQRESCDALVYDDLIDRELLDLAPEGCEKIYVGKRCGRHSMKQEEINRLLIEQAQLGRRVVRLKGGDPYVFGRGGEEFLALLEAGISCSCLPGISSAIAAPAAAGIPVTHRNLSRSVTIVTGTTAREGARSGPDLDFETLARLDGTLVILMGMHCLETIAARLMEAGKSPDTPAAVIMEGATPGQRSVRAPLRDLAQRAVEAGLKAPAVIIIGKVAGLKLLAEETAVPKASPLAEEGVFPEGEKGPLAGVRVGVTGSRSFVEHLSARLSEEGARAEDLGFLEIRPLPGRLPDFSSWDWLVFTSPNGVSLFQKAMRKERRDLRCLAGKKIAAIGPGTAAALEEAGLYPDFVPEIHDAAHLGEGLCRRMLERREEGNARGALFLRAAAGSAQLPQAFARCHIPFLDWPLYGTGVDREAMRAAKERMEGRPAPDYLIFGSASGVRAWFDEAKGFFPPEGGRAPGKEPVYVCMGPACAAQFRALSDRPFLTAERSNADGIVDCLKEEEERRRASEEGRINGRRRLEWRRICRDFGG